MGDGDDPRTSGINKLSEDPNDAVDDQLVPLQSDQIQAILRFLPAFERVAQQYARQGPGDPAPQDASRNETRSAFVAELYALGVIQPFDWMNWDRAPEFSDLKASLRRASLDDLHKLLIGHVRFGRFCTGHLDLMVEEGDLVMILQRLAEVVDSVEGGLKEI